MLLLTRVCDQVIARLPFFLASILFGSLPAIAASDRRHALVCTSKDRSSTSTVPEYTAVTPNINSTVQPSPTSQVNLSLNTATPTIESHSNIDITVYDNNGSYGACGTKLYDTDMVAALAKPAWGQSTYDTMTGRATNPWCGQKIQIQYNGRFVEATIMDLCPLCVGYDVDLSLAAWNELTGKIEKTRLKGSWIKLA